MELIDFDNLLVYFFLKEFIPAIVRQSIEIARKTTKYLRFIAHEKLIKKDNIIIAIPIAKAIP
jgi:hypothetical protein